MLHLVKSPGGHARVVSDTLSVLVVTDSGSAPESSIQVLSIEIDGNTFEVAATYASRADLVADLNTTLGEVLGTLGEFAQLNSSITYTNPEGFENIELMILRNLQKLVFTPGDDFEPEEQYIQHEDFVGADIQLVHVGNVYLSSGDYTHNDERIDFTQAYDGVIEVHFNQPIP